MVVGKFGKILTFKVETKPNGFLSSQPGVKCLTFSDFKRVVRNRTNEHPRIGRKPAVEFEGPELSTMTFTITFSASLGVNPRKQLKKLEKCVRQGVADYFIVGKKKIGKHRYLITEMPESWDVIVKKGELVEAKADISLMEYL